MRHTKGKTVLYVILGAIFIVAVFIYAHQSQPSLSTPIATAPVVSTPVVAPVKTTPIVEGEVYKSITLATATPLKELEDMVGQSNVQTVLELNRIDGDDLRKGATLIIPHTFADMLSFSPFPTSIAAATEIPKLMIVSQTVQAFAIYEYGTLVRWGGVNTGKQSTPTPNQLYFANWKGKKVTSSEDDDWILPWYVNLDNNRGISMHQYQLPGYPASHACVRMFADDAEWIYNWVDQWTVSDDGQTVLTYGTPVIVFGDYAFGKTPPWKKLATNPDATVVASETLETLVNSDKAEILSHSM